MALQTKTFSSQTTSNGYTLILTLVENSTDIVANTSSISYTLTLKSETWDFAQYGLGAKIILDGVVVASRDRYTAPQVSLPVNSSLKILNGTTTIAHNTDGSKKLSVAFSIDMAKATYTPGPINVTGKSMTLTQIPRASTIGATDANIGATSMIAVNRKSSGYTHSIAYKFGTLSGYITESGGVSAEESKFTNTSIAFTVPTSFYDQIPNAKTGTCTLTIRTYSDTTQIGDAQTCTFTATAAEADCKPTVSGVVVDSNDVTKALTGDDSKLVRYYSTALCTITATAKKSATISSKTIGGTTVSENTMSIPNVESGNVVFSAKDSRGYSASDTVNATMVPYIKLTNNAIGGRTDPTSGNATLTLKGNYYSGSFGAVDNTLEIKYRIEDGEYISVIPTISGNTYSADVPLTDLDYTQAYTIETIVTDKLASVTKNITIGKGIPVFDWGEEDFNFNVPVTISGSPLLDYVIDQGTSGIWTYRKWASGIAECWCRKVYENVPINTSWGSGYYAGLGTPENYPFSFVDFPCVNMTLQATTGNGWGIYNNSNYSVLNPGGIFVYNPTLQSAVNITVNISTIGKWK